MNNTNISEKYIDEAKDIKLLYHELLSDDPDNFAYKISIKSTEKHIKELQYQLKREQEKINPDLWDRGMRNLIMLARRTG